MFGIRLIATLLATLFLLGQGLAYAHTIEYGPQHDHEGAACTVSVLGEDEAVVPAPLETLSLPEDHAPIIDLPIVRSVPFTSVNPLRGPPPRAPPA